MSTAWEKRESRYLAKYRIFDLREDICISPRTGEAFPFYVLETRDWINIVPVTEDGLIVMVRQYRFGTGEVTLEIPGGLVDHEDGSVLEAARREMLEETGYDSNEIISLGKVRPNPAIQNNTCHIFLAKNARKISEQCLDTSEDIMVELFSRKEINDMIKGGMIDHCMVLNCFYFLDLFEQNNLT